MNLYKFERCLGYGSINGLFIAEPEKVQEIIGKKLYFGEVCGKHSEVEIELEEEDIELVTEDEDLISDLRIAMGNTDNLMGYNPISQYRYCVDELEMYV